MNSVEFVELKGIEPSFPLVGEFTLSDGRPFDPKLLENNGAVAGRVLLEQLHVNVGDKIKIGDGDFQSARRLMRSPVRAASGFRLGAADFCRRKAFDAAGITANEPRPAADSLSDLRQSDAAGQGLRSALKGTTMQVNSYREQQENLNQNFERTENYLSLTGPVDPRLGGVGVWNVARAFVEQKRKTVAVLKCLGASGTRVYHSLSAADTDARARRESLWRAAHAGRVVARAVAIFDVLPAR